MDYVHDEREQCLADANRRSLLINIVRGAPDSQTKDFDSLEEVRERRPKLVAAGLMIFKAYIGAGWPRDSLSKKKIGTFNQFDRDIRGAGVENSVVPPRFLNSVQPVACRRS
jgi:hypothetical protein